MARHDALLMRTSGMARKRPPHADCGARGPQMLVDWGGAAGGFCGCRGDTLRLRRAS